MYVRFAAESSLTLVTPWTVTRQAPLSMGFSRQEYWSGLPFSSPGDLLNPGVEPKSPVSSALAGRFFTTSATWEAHTDNIGHDNASLNTNAHFSENGR